MVFFVVKAILTEVPLNNLVINFVSLPIYVNFAHLFVLCFVFLTSWHRLGPSRFVMGLLYLLLYKIWKVHRGFTF